ncbi:MAG: deoxyribose-phosphate aldolase [candidate division Zixibacteria bacterium SM23_73_2]|nr:MAG: deoxyribose-phosphate aldolase [candidate division Zixibacteria bacterium SM23_73_2]
MNIQKLIDHTILRPDAQEKDIVKLCEEGKKYGFFSVCVNSFWVNFCYKFFSGSEGSRVRVCSVSGFPLGASTVLIKSKEAEENVKNGADEVDMVINIGALKDRNFKLLEKEIKSVKSAVGEDRILKVILETGVLTLQEKKDGAKIVLNCGADFVKTSTGFGLGGAKVEDVKLLKEVVGNKIGVKASGGIRDYQTALKMIQAGAIRIGTSAGPKIMESKES